MSSNKNSSSDKLPKISVRCGVNLAALEKVFKELKGESEEKVRAAVVSALTNSLVFKQAGKKRGSGKSKVESTMYIDGACNRKHKTRGKEEVYCNKPCAHKNGDVLRCNTCMPSSYYFSDNKEVPVVEALMVSNKGSTAYMAKGTYCLGWAETDTKTRMCKITPFTPNDMRAVFDKTICGDHISFRCSASKIDGDQCTRTASGATGLRENADGTVCAVCQMHAKK